MARVSTKPRFCQIPWVGANQCNCSSGPGVSATIPDPDSPMVFLTWAWGYHFARCFPAPCCPSRARIPCASQCPCPSHAGRAGTVGSGPAVPVARLQVNYVGRSKVFLPYYFYKEPLQNYPVSVPVGDNLSFPRKGACTETQNLGDAGCTWKRLPTSRMLYVPATQYSVLLRLNGGGGRENGDFAFFSLLTTAHVLSMHPTLTSGVRTPLTSQVWLRPARRRVEHHGHQRRTPRRAGEPPRGDRPHHEKHRQLQQGPRRPRLLPHPALLRLLSNGAARA